MISYYFIKINMMMVIVLLSTSLFADESQLKSKETITKGLIIELNEKDLEPQSRGITVVPKRQQLERRTDGRINLDIRFEFNSAKLDRYYRDQVNALGESLVDTKLHKRMFLIVGHTDSIGSALYNQQLSLRRAEEVKNYLTHKFGITSSRLIVQGWGESNPVDSDYPDSGVNRRVEIFNIFEAVDR